ncbi:MAG: 6-carboxytetrahydropterin synthase, partial [Phycisphaerales bacterium]|nr:6-carboxytetrahydropterin synthase [Phycisphaerales bacterium]
MNSYAGQPMCSGLSAYYEVESWCHAPPDPRTGFVESIYLIDKAVRHHVVPILAEAFGSRVPPHTLVRAMFDAVDREISSTLMRISWRLSPYHELAMDRSDMQHVIVKRRYTFSAAHRLRNVALDDKGNEELYGKCAWPSGHGHNYELEVSIATPIDPDANAMSIAEMDEIVHAQVIDLFDHRNLDQDIE